MEGEIIEKSASVAPLYEGSGVNTRISKDQNNSAEKGLLATWKGVFLPCLQNILGVILFLRVPWMAGQAGIVVGLGIIVTCISVTVLTAISLSAIATNGHIPAGGPYYVVSRNLGQAFGGAIGLAFFLGTAVASTMYILGAVEAFQTTFGFESSFSFDTQIEGIAVTLALMVIVTVGLGAVNRAATLFLLVVLVSIASGLVGIILFASGLDFGNTSDVSRSDGEVSLWPSFEYDEGFGRIPNYVSLVGLYFPSVTGIMAGANRSGVLKNPGKSIPRGTLGAILVTSSLDVIFLVLFGLFVSNTDLKTNKLVVSTVAWPHEIVVGIGIMMTGIGAGLQTIVSASQLLKSIIDDDVFPCLRFLGRKPQTRDKRCSCIPCSCCKTSGRLPSTPGSPSSKATAGGVQLEAVVGDDAVGARAPQEPHAANIDRNAQDLEREVDDEHTNTGAGWKEIAVTGLFAALMCLPGNLDAITPVLAILFLMMYGTINVACFILAALKQPGFRLSLLGIIACLAVMIIVSWWASILGFVVMWLLYKYIELRSDEQQWGGGAVEGLRLEQARKALLALRGRQISPKNWRPQLLVFSKMVDSEPKELSIGLLHFAAQLKKGKGLVVVGHVIEDPALSTQTLSHGTQQTQEATQRKLKSTTLQHGVDGFCRVVTSVSRRNGMISMSQMAGLGALEPSMAILGWPSTWESDPIWCNGFVDVLHTLKVAKKGVLLMRGHENFPKTDMVEVKRRRLRSQKPPPVIDVWWVVHDGGLMLALAALLKRHVLWRKATIRVFVVFNPTAGISLQQTGARMSWYLQRIRIDARVIPIMVPSEVIADAWHDRTLDMEKRRQLLAELKGEEIKSAPERRAPLSAIFQGLSTSEPLAEQEGEAKAKSTEPLATAQSNNTSCEDLPEAGETVQTPPPEDRLAVAMKLHQLMKEHSQNSELVLCSMPLTSSLPPTDLMTYLDTLTSGLRCALLVCGSGEEVVTDLA